MDNKRCFFVCLFVFMCIKHLVFEASRFWSHGPRVPQNFTFGRSGSRSPKGYRLYKGVAAVPFLFWYFTGWLSYRDPIHHPTEVFSWYSWEVRKPWLFRGWFPNLFGIIRGHSRNTLVPKHCNRDTVDGRHPAPVDMANSWQLFRFLQGFYTSQCRISSNSMGLGFFQETYASQWTMELADIEVTDCFLECEGKETLGSCWKMLEVGVSWMSFILRIDWIMELVQWVSSIWLHLIL